MTQYIRVDIETPYDTIVEYQALDGTESKSALDGIAQDMFGNWCTYGHSVVDEGDVPEDGAVMVEASKEVKVVREEFIRLDLTMEEARTVFAALWRVGGSPTNSPRGIVDRVRDALTGAVRERSNPDPYDDSWAAPEIGLFGGGPGITAKDYPA